MERGRNAFGYMFFSTLGLLLFGTTSWALSQSVLDASDPTDPAWLLAEAPAPASGAVVSTIPEKKNEKSPGVAISLALVPGVALHGAGFLYAGRPWTASALLLAEAGGLYLAYRGGEDMYSAVDGDDFNKFTNYRGDTGQLSHGMGLALGGVMIFLSSWFFDLAGSPLAVEQANAANKPGLATTAAPEITPRLTAHGFEVALEKHF
jgi:hypothetical protein